MSCMVKIYLEENLADFETSGYYLTSKERSLNEMKPKWTNMDLYVSNMAP